MSAENKLVYFFGQGRAEGTAAMKDVLGGKGAGLAEMTNIGIPVPPGFTIASTMCLPYLESRHFPPRLQQQVEGALQRLEAATGKSFGSSKDPLLVSVRSGAAVSMPGRRRGRSSATSICRPTTSRRWWPSSRRTSAR